MIPWFDDDDTETVVEQPDNNQGNDDGLDVGDVLFGVAIAIIVILAFKLIRSIFE